MTQHPTLRERVHYNIDNYLARGSSALFLSLLFAFLIAFTIIVILRLFIYWISPDPAASFSDQLWRVYLQLTAPGNMNQDSNSPHQYKIPAVVAGLTGVVIFSTLIATLTTALNQMIRSFKRGHSRVLEEDFTLVLGWTPRVLEILRELVEANESEDNPSVVILSQHDKEQMDEYLRGNFRDRRNMRVVTRQGSTTSPESLRHVSVEEAKSVIVLADSDENAPPKEQLSSDARGIKTVLALEAAAPEADFPIVIELHHPRNREVVQGVAPERAHMVDAEEILAKVMVQTSRTSGLSVVYSELLSFEGCEMYFYNSTWDGMQFGQSQFHFPDGVPIGVRSASGELRLRPALDYVLKSDDEILIIADDDSTIEFLSQPVMTPDENLQEGFEEWRLEPKKERLLILGWSSKAEIIISEYGEYVAEGSSVTVVLHEPSPEMIDEINAVMQETEDLGFNLVEANAFELSQLKELRPFDYNDIMVLPQKLSENRNAEEIDTETIVLLLLLRGLKDRLRESGEIANTKILTEVLESKNHSLIHQAGVNDFIISNRMISMIFAQMSEEPGIKAVYDDLFQEDGSEIYVKPIELYFDKLPVKARFGDFMRRAQKRDDEACIGIKIGAQANDADQNYGVTLIPLKDEVIELGPGDSLIVVAEDER